MNTQLRLLDVKETHGTAQKKTRKAESNSQVWWKLSQEDRELGLRGVRAIRNILQNTRPEDQNTFAQAS